MRAIDVGARAVVVCQLHGRFESLHFCAEDEFGDCGSEISQSECDLLGSVEKKRKSLLYFTYALFDRR